MTGHQRPDSEILARLPGRPEPMGVLYERHAPAVFRYLARRAGPSAAEDLLSEVFIAALDGRARVVAHDSGSALPWLYGIASGWLTWDEIYALPTDPAKLAPLLTRDSTGLAYGSMAQNLWSVVFGLLVETPASPALREALYDVAASLPGVAVNSDYTDLLGQTGTALSLSDRTLVIDPASGQLLTWIDDEPGVAGSRPVAYTYTYQGPATSAP